jgi:hypothetical protein
MATTNGNRKILDLKRWEFVTPAPTATVASSQVISSRHYRQQQLYVASTANAWLYNSQEDGWAQVPAAGLATFAAGACGVAGAFSTGTTVAASSLTATAGNTTSITTNQTIARDLRGYSVYFVGGTNAGRLKTIASNTIGTNAVITFEGTAEATPFDATSQYRLKTPVWFVFGAGTLAAGSFRKYCFATNSWTTLANTGLPATFGTDGRLVSTPAWIDTGFQSFATGTATAGAATTLTNSGKAWAPNQWTNSQLRITGGTGAGQIRTVASNTGTVLTVSAAWTTNPDATSTYSLEGNDDFLYLMGNNAVAMYRYSISGNSWSTLAPTAARAAAPGAASSGHWVWGASDSAWTAENSIINGRRIYSFRGGGGAVLDYYDIAANTWVSGVTYAPATETFTTGTKYAYSNNFIYIQKDATGRWFRHNVVTSEQDGWNTMTYTQGAALLGDTCFDVEYRDGATEIVYIYMVLNTSTVMLRQMVV